MVNLLTEYDEPKDVILAEGCGAIVEGSLQEPDGKGQLFDRRVQKLLAPLNLPMEVNGWF